MVKMQTEDYIYQNDIALSKYPLSKKHVMAISATAFLACSLYFVLPQGSTHSTRTYAPVYGSIQDDGSYDDILDPTRSLTDILLTDDAVPASNRDVVLANSSTQRVFVQSGSDLENYDEEDLSMEIAMSAESNLEEHLNELASTNTNAPAAPQWVTEEIQPGDTLSSIFSDLNIPYIVMQTLANNEEAGSSLVNLRPGNKLYFSFDSNSNLIGFVKQINGDEQWHFTRSDVTKNEFSVKREPSGAHIMIASSDGTLKPMIDEGNMPAYKMRGRLVVATIDKGDSFSTAAHEAGLTYNEIKQITDLFKGRVQFTRHLQPGDTLRVLFSDVKGEGKINAVELNLKKLGKLAAYRNVDDNKYYDEGGYNSTSSTFRRFPLDGKVVISSHFNPNRRHPVTHKVRPHNGTDFAVPVGTPVVAPADGVVEIAKFSRSAGYYITIRHRGNFSTVYMHLSKLLVKPGQRVKIGQMIARSGNTGISTGPHLHYELRRNKLPINAMRVTLPANEDATIAQKNRQRFDSNVALFKKELYQDSLIAQNQK